ncbi:YggS family pyridoxal phosphate-dependent enzyme [Methanosarcinaceae archaeon]|nr:YggS family pyridoxal phosphate-dependent enzyme [Methanosarcinaceae archaeon]
MSDVSEKSELLSKEEFRENLRSVLEKMTAAAERSGRDISEITLLPVTKTKPADVIIYSCEEGLSEVGENQVQEILEKQTILSGNPETADLKFHLIGHLQRNKVRDIVGKVVLIHSLDSLPLAEKINNASEALGIFSDVLIEINAAGEESKFGIAPEETETFLNELEKYDHLCIRGLMTVAPAVDDPEENRPVFRNMKSLFDRIREKSEKFRSGSGKWANVDMQILSMGMTNDFEVAIEEGSTLVRIGTALFGKRTRNLNRNRS